MTSGRDQFVQESLFRDRVLIVFVKKDQKFIIETFNLFLYFIGESMNLQFLLVLLELLTKF
jgi:hypothetical protein